MAGGNEVVAIGVLVDGVDVEVIPGAAVVFAAPADFGTARRNVTFRGVDVVEASPFEDDLPRVNIDFLECALLDVAQAITEVPGAQVVHASKILSHKRGLAFVDEHKLVHVR